jgi:hypothetical protein
MLAFEYGVCPNVSAQGLSAVFSMCSLHVTLLSKVTPKCLTATLHVPSRKHSFRNNSIVVCVFVAAGTLPRNGLHNAVVYQLSAWQRLYMLHLSHPFRGLCLATGPYATI